jgi:hypothetical protein
MRNVIESFTLEDGTVVSRGEALRVFIAAVYNTAKAQPSFTTDDVYLRVQGYPVAALRRATANSKLVAVALRKSAEKGYATTCVHTEGAARFAKGDGLSHNRVKRIWHRGAHFNQ